MDPLAQAMEHLTNNLVGLSARDRRMGRQLVAEIKVMNASLAADQAAARAKIDNARLPECSGFTGTGRRCSSCKILKTVHD